jgi:hypothetical protein
MDNQFNAGVEMDTIIIFNGDNTYFDHLDNTRTKNGKMYVRHRENIGSSFGGYNYAYENFNYDFYLFHEEDFMMVGDGYYSFLLSKWNDKIGYVTLIGNRNQEPPCDMDSHCHGGIGLTSRKILDQVYKKLGHLPHSDEGQNDDRQHTKVVYSGEIPFTNEIKKLGYELTYFGTPRWEFKNHIMPYYML